MSISLGLVGCGDISNFHARAIEAVKEKIQFTACCDVDRRRAEEWAGQYGVARTYGSLEEMLRSENHDAILLATWPNLHRHQIEICLDSGIKNILCEKALSITGTEALEIWNMVEAAGAFLMEGFMYRHHPAIRRMERLVQSGEIGEVDYVRAAFNAHDPEVQPADDPDLNWRQRPDRGGGVPYDFACYAINACGHFARGVPTRVSATGSVSTKYRVLDRMFGIIDYANGRVGIVESTKKSDSNQELAVFGSIGMLRLPIAWTIKDDTTMERVFHEDWATPQRDLFSIQKSDAYALQIENFADVVDGNTEPQMPLAQSVINAHVTEALVKSVLERTCIDIEIPDPISSAYQRSMEEK